MTSCHFSRISKILPSESESLSTCRISGWLVGCLAKFGKIFIRVCNYSINATQASTCFLLLPKTDTSLRLKNEPARKKCTIISFFIFKSSTFPCCGLANRSRYESRKGKKERKKEKKIKKSLKKKSPQTRNQTYKKVVCLTR